MGLWDAVKRVLVTWAINSYNLIYFVITYGGTGFSEGRFYKFAQTWVNWNFYFTCKPKEFLRATRYTTEKDLCNFVRNASQVRVVAGGHSFNDGTLTDFSLLNLDGYDKVEFDFEKGTATVQAGIRLRKLLTLLENTDYDLPVMGTTNVQSLGGLIATDLHATGKKSGFLSQQILSIRIINSQGIAETFSENSDVFRYAIGGIGALGVVVEATLKLVPKFKVKRVTQYVDRKEAEAALEKLLEKHDHVGFFYIGGLGAKKIRLTTYDHAQKYEQRTSFYYFKQYCLQIFDLLNGGFFLDFVPYFPFILNIGYFIFNNTFLGQPFVGYAGEAFTSELFFRHDEMEYVMPFENFRKTISELMNYLDQTTTISLMEVRFTIKDAQTKSLIGPGTGRESCWIEILPTLTHDSRAIFASTENIFAKNDGRPHLGKYTTYHASDMRRHYGDATIDQFLKARERQDPRGKFTNQFVNQIFLDESESNPTHPRKNLN